MMTRLILTLLKVTEFLLLRLSLIHLGYVTLVSKLLQCSIISRLNLSDLSIDY
jgi:hypothetical protein